ncbi:MAG: COX15/CtaA family protein [Thermoleophilia bacterium]|nr:COX15/CtaA family protein [Thermoleophilia bacterium]
MQVASSSLARVRAFELSPRAFRVLALAAAASLYAIVISGATVRLTASGLGCESWPGCQAGSFFPESSHHGWIEFGNRAVALFPLSLTLLAWLGARRTPGLSRAVAWIALATFAGTLAQAPLGFVTIYFELHPLLVLAHFLLALAVLAGAVVVGVHAWGNDRGFADERPVRTTRAATLALLAAASALVVSGTLATAAGPHSGDPEVRRLGILHDAVHLHVQVSAAFAAVLAVTLVLLVRERRRFPGLLAVAALLVGLLVAQGVVGEVQWRTRLPWGLVLVHVALAAAVWAVTVAVAALAFRPLASLHASAHTLRESRTPSGSPSARHSSGHS